MRVKSGWAMFFGMLALLVACGGPGKAAPGVVEIRGTGETVTFDGRAMERAKALTLAKSADKWRLVVQADVLLVDVMASLTVLGSGGGPGEVLVEGAETSDLALYYVPERLRTPPPGAKAAGPEIVVTTRLLPGQVAVYFTFRFALQVDGRRLDLSADSEVVDGWPEPDLPVACSSLVDESQQQICAEAQATDAVMPLGPYRGTCEWWEPADPRLAQTKPARPTDRLAVDYTALAAFTATTRIIGDDATTIGDVAVAADAMREAGLPAPELKLGGAGALACPGATLRQEEVQALVTRWMATRRPGPHEQGSWVPVTTPIAPGSARYRFELTDFASDDVSSDYSDRIKGAFTVYECRSAGAVLPVAGTARVEIAPGGMVTVLTLDLEHQGLRECLSDAVFDAHTLSGQEEATGLGRYSLQVRVLAPAP